MKLQALNLSPLIFIFIITFIVSAENTEASARKSAQSQCMIYREYIDDKRFMHFNDNRVLSEYAGSSKRGCKRVCEKLVKTVPTAHLPYIGKTTNVRYTCQYSSENAGPDEYVALLHGKAPLNTLKAQRKRGAARTYKAPVKTPLINQDSTQNKQTTAPSDASAPVANNQEPVNEPDNPYYMPKPYYSR